MQFAILDTNTRVIKRLTSDAVPSVSTTETAVDVSANPIDLKGFLKLEVDNKTLLTPTQNEIDASGVDESRNSVLKLAKQQAVKTALDSILTDPVIPQKIKDYFTALKNL